MYANRMVAETVPNLKLNRIRLVYVIWKKWFDSTNYFLFILVKNITLIELSTFN